MIWAVTNDINTAIERGYIGELKARTFPELRPIALAVHCAIYDLPVPELKVFYYYGERDAVLSNMFGKVLHEIYGTDNDINRSGWMGDRGNTPFGPHD